MIKSASHDNLSTTSARAANPDVDSLDSEMDKLFLGGESAKSTHTRETVPEYNSNRADGRERGDSTSVLTGPTNNDGLPSAPSAVGGPPQVIIRPSLHPIQVPNYNVKDVETWIRMYEMVGLANSWSNNDLYNRLYLAFEKTNQMNYLLKLIEKRIIYDWPSAKREFLKRKINPSGLTISDEANARVQGIDEGVMDYILAKQALYDRVEPELPPGYVVYQVIKGMLPDLASELFRYSKSQEKTLTDVNELLPTAVDFERFCKSDPLRNEKLKKAKREEERKTTREISPGSYQNFPKDIIEGFVKQNLRSELSILDHTIKGIKETQDRILKNMPRQTKNRFGPNSNNQAAPSGGNATGNQSVNFDAPLDSRTCFNCGERGHFIKDCPKPLKENRGRGRGRAQNQGNL